MGLVLDERLKRIELFLKCRRRRERMIQLAPNCRSRVLFVRPGDRWVAAARSNMCPHGLAYATDMSLIAGNLSGQLLVPGAVDSATDWRQAFERATAVSLRVVEDGGHLLTLEAPDVVANAITEFLRSSE